jgi:hypothetical protein
MQRWLWTLLMVWAAGIGVAAAQAVEIDHDAMRATRIVTAVRVTETITVHGRLTEPAWEQAMPATCTRAICRGAPRFSGARRSETG